MFSFRWRRSIPDSPRPGNILFFFIFVLPCVIDGRGLDPALLGIQAGDLQAFRHLVNLPIDYKMLPIN
jgi:hypothetical protein